MLKGRDGGRAVNPNDKIEQRLEELTRRGAGRWSGYSDMIAWAGNILRIVEILKGKDAPATKTLQNIYDDFSTYRGKHGQVRSDHFIDSFRGTLAAVKSDYEAGLLVDIRAEIRSEVHGDFFGQAQSLLEQGLKDPAAMLIGAVLEDALRQLCQKHNIPEGRSIERMNVPLRQARAYGLPQQQQITAWAAIRNNADHGRFEEYSVEEVRLMSQGVTDFIVKYLTQ